MNFVLAQLRRSTSALLVALTAFLLVAPALVHAQSSAQSEVQGESRDFRSTRNGRWVDLTTWQVYRSGVWVSATREVGVPNGASNVFIETNHTIVATRANTEAIQYNGAQSWAFLEVNDLHINTAASITTTFGSVIATGFLYDAAGNNIDKYDGDGYSRTSLTAQGGGTAGGGTNGLTTQPSLGAVSTTLSAFSPGNSATATPLPGGTLGGYPFNRIGNMDVFSAPNTSLEPSGGTVPTPRNMELRVYGKLRYYAGAALDKTDRDANIQVTAATIGTGSTIVFRGVTRVITQPQEWSTTLATATGYFANTAQTANLGVGGLAVVNAGDRTREANFRGLMGRNSFWTAIFDLGRVVDRNFSVDQFTGPTDDPSTVVGTLQGNFTAGIIQIRRGTVRFEGEALLANEGASTSGSIQIMNNSILQIVSGNIGRTAVPLATFSSNFGNAAQPVAPASWGYTVQGAALPGGATSAAIPQTPNGEYGVTSRMRYFAVEEGGALDFVGVVGTLSANDVRFNGTVIYSRTGDQTLVGDSRFLSFNPAGTITTLTAGGVQVNAGENGLFDPYNNNFNGNNAVVVGDPRPGVIDPANFGSAPAGLGVGTAALFQPSTTAAYSHLVLRGSGTKFLIATTVTISRALIFQGEARVGIQNVAGDGTVVTINGANLSSGLPYWLQQPTGGELFNNNAAAAVATDGFTRSKAGFFPALVYLRGTGLNGFRQENNIGTTFRGTLNLATEADSDPTSGAVPQTMWSVYGGNTDPVIFVGFTTASTRPIIYDQDMYPEGASYPVGMVISGSLNREQIDMSPWNKPGVVHGLPAEPTYDGNLNTIGDNHGYTARAYTYLPGGTTRSQTLDAARTGQVIRQTVDRVNGSGSPMGFPTVGIANVAGVLSGNFIRNFPVITNSIHDYAINTSATTTLQYDSEASDIMSQIEFPAGVTGPHNLVMNCASNVSQTLPIRTIDYRPFDASGINWANIAHLNFLNKTSGLFGATAGTVVLGPEYVNSTNANLPRNAISPSTGLYQASAIYNQNGIGLTNTPGVLATAYIDTRPDVANAATKINDRYYTTGVGLRPSVSLTGTFDGRVRGGFPTQRVVGPTFTGASQTAYVVSPANDFGRRGDYNNFGVVELRRGNLNIPNKNLTVNLGTVAAPVAGTFNYLFVLSSTAIISKDQANVTFQGVQVGANNAAAQVVLSEATGAEQYPSFSNWSAAGVRNASANPSVATPAVVRGPGGPANLAGTIVGGSLSNIVFTGGTGGTIDGNLLASARNGGSSSVNATGAAGATFTNGNGPQPVHYAATDNTNTGNTELSRETGIPGLQAFAPSYTSSLAGVPTGAKLAGASTDRFNAGPEMTNDADVTLASIVYGADAISNQTALAAGIQSGNNQVYPGGPSLTVNAGHTSSSYNSGVVRANNAWNIDLPYVRSGLQHVTFLRATSNVMTLVGNLDNSTNNPNGSPINIDAPGLTTANPEISGLQVYGTIATARGDIDLNGRNIELGGNNSMLVEAFERTQYVDSIGGRPRWTAIQVGMPRGFSNGNINGSAPGSWTNGVVTAPYRTGDPLPVYPTRPSSVINNHRNVRAYIGLTSGRNVQSMNQNLGINQVSENPAGLGAYIYQTANPAQFRVRRWQTRGNGLNGALSTRPGVRTADRYWQVETTGTLNILMARSEIRLQYIDTDLNNENGTTAGLPPASLNMFRAQGQPLIAPNSPFIGPFQALFAQQLVGLDSYNFVKQLTITGPTQVVNGATVLNTGNFATGDPASGRLPDAVNPQNPQAGFQIWAIGIPAPRCLVLRGQRFGGSFGDRPGSGFGVAAGQDIVGFPPPFGSFATGGGISAATAEQYGAIIGPFKAGYATNATIIADLLDEFGNVATTNFSTGASLVVGQVSNGTLGPWNTGVPSLFQGNNGFPSGRIGALAGNGGLTANATTGGPVGGRFEWPNVRLDGVASTTITFTLVNDFVGDATQLGASVLPRLDAQVVAANGGSFALPVANPTSTITYCDNQAVQVSLQGGFPFSVTFATQNANNTGATNLYPGAAGPLAAPGNVAVDAVNGIVGYDGSIPTNRSGVPTNGVVVGQTVTFPYATPGFGSITVIVKDRFGNFSSFPTTATISIAGGSPPVDQQRTPLVGQVATSTVVWGLGNLGLETAGAPQLAQPGIARVYGAGGDGLTQAPQTAQQVNPANLPTGNNLLNSRASLVSPALAPTGSGYAPFNNPQVASHFASFPNFQIWGATSSNVTLVVATGNFDPNAPIGNGNAPGNTSATIHIVPGAAVGIAPVIVPDIYNRNQPDRMPSRMYIGRSNNSDPRTWFYVQAVDQFGNRVDNGPNAYNGGTANITFRTPQQGLPGNAAGTFQFTQSNPADPYVKANNQAYAATGTSAQAVFGLYTFNNFIPTGPASIDPLGKDVVLTFEDLALPGVRAPLASGATGLFRPIPPVTTATTTFLPVPRVSFSVPDAGQAGAPANGAAKVGTNALVLQERARTYISGNNTLQSGSLRVSRDPGQVANDITVGYTVTYFDASSAVNPATYAITNRANLRPLPNIGTTVLQLPAPLPAGVVTTPAFPAPTPVAINGLQGDLAPNTTPAGRAQSTVNVTAPGVPATFFLDAGVSQQLVNFTARYSDQSWPRNPGIQGVRLAVLNLLPPDALNSTIYDVDRTNAADSGFVVLLDPAPVPPVITNAIQDKQLLRPTGTAATEDRIELESPQWRADNVPGFVFYDDNYNPMTYTATSSDATIVSVRVRDLDSTVVGGATDPRPTLYYAVQPGAAAGATAVITVVASDGTTQTDGQRRLATDQFNVTVRNSITSVAVDPAAIGFSVSPNPTVERFTVQAQAAKAGTVRVNVVNMLGQVVRSVNFEVGAGEVYSREFDIANLATGAYTVQINDGVNASAMKVIKN
ncbi:MAG: T9SS type A sorting domain-containing protein [Ignavibacteria bacterium]|nr:T9SS type A sorting domain-containing protein [Ignavibacteria bacterium]